MAGMYLMVAHLISVVTTPKALKRIIGLASAVLAAMLLVCSAATGQPAAKVTYLGDHPYTRYEVTLTEALPSGYALTLHLGRQAGEFSQTWAHVPTTGVVAVRVDTSALELSDGRLHGRVDVWTNTEDGSPLYRAVYDLDLAVDGNRIEQVGYTGRYSVRTRTLVFHTDDYLVTPDDVSLFAYGDRVEGDITGAERQAPAVDSKPARFELNSNHLLSGSLAWTRHVIIRFDIDGDEVSDVKFLPRRYDDQSRFQWSAEIQEVDLAFEDDRLHGYIAAEVTGGQNYRTDDGIYTMRVDARVSHNQVVGTLSQVKRDGRRIGDNSVSGYARGLYKSDDDHVYVLALSRGIAANDELSVRLRWSDGEFLDGVAKHPRLPDVFAVDVEQIELAGDGLKGTLPVHFTPDAEAIGGREAFTVDYEIDVRFDDVQANGSFYDNYFGPVDVNAPASDNADGRAIAGRYEATFGPIEQVAGAAAGRVQRGEKLKERYGFQEGHDWPAWNGPYGNFTAIAGDHELLDRLQDARLLWKSEHLPPGRMQVRRYGAEGTIRRYMERGGPAGGGSSPIVANGIVYFYHLRPNLDSEDVAAHVDEWVKEGRRTFGPELWANEGEDVIIAIDAATGETVWKTVVPDGEYDHTGKINYTAMSAVGGGRVYVRAKNRTLGLDAETGELLWVNTEHGGPLVVALDDMAIFSGRNVTALDADTGELRWRIEGVGESTAAPLHWEHDGDSYIISGNRSGRVVCIRAEDGELMWEIDDAGSNQHGMVLGENHLVLNVGDDGNRLGAYRISPQGAERAWSLSPEYPFHPQNGKLPAVDGDHVFFQTYRGPNKLLVIDIENGQILHQLNTRQSSTGYVHRIADRLLIQEDATHGRTLVDYYRADGDRLEQLGSRWDPPHSQTTGYHPLMTTHAIADGRIFIRGQRGIYCYDLRAR